MEYKKKKTNSKSSKINNYNDMSQHMSQQLVDIMPNEKFVENYISYALSEHEKEQEGWKTSGDRQNKKEGNKDAVEKQLKKLVEHLYSLKFKLEKDKKKEKDKRYSTINDSNIKSSTKNKGSEALLRREKDSISIFNPSNKKCVLKKLERKTSVANNIPELIRTAEIYKNRNDEEKKNNKYIINKYESIIRNIKKQHIDEINEIKNTILEDVDFLIQKYRNIALELLEIMKRKEKKNEVEKKKLTEICVSACKKFEEDVKQKAKASLQDYKNYMVKQNESIKREKDVLQKKINEMKKSGEEEKHLIEKEIIESCEKRLKEETEINKKLKNQLIFERRQHNVLIGSLYSKIDEQIKVYEESIINIVHKVLEENNVTIDISELQDLIKTSMDEQYRKELMEIEQTKKMELEKNKMNIKYGFTSIYNR